MISTRNKTMALQVQLRYSSKLFIQSTKDREFTCDASQLARLPNNFMGRIYDDAIDLGFAIVSERTGNEAVWYHSQTVCDDEGDVREWVFLPTRETVQKMPQLRDYKVIVFND
jgi:hypothetical protein